MKILQREQIHESIVPMIARIQVIECAVISVVRIFIAAGHVVRDTPTPGCRFPLHAGMDHVGGVIEAGEIAELVCALQVHSPCFTPAYEASAERIYAVAHVTVAAVEVPVLQLSRRHSGLGHEDAVKVAIEVSVAHITLVVALIGIDRDRRAGEQLDLPRSRVAENQADAIVRSRRVDPIRRPRQPLIAEVKRLPSDTKRRSAEVMFQTGLMDIEVIGIDVRYGRIVDGRHAGRTLAEDSGILQLDEDVGPVAATIAEIQTEPGEEIALLAAVEV